MTSLKEVIGDKIMEFNKPKDIIIKINTIISYTVKEYEESDDLYLRSDLRTFYAKFEKKEMKEGVEFEFNRMEGIVKMDNLDKLLSIKNYHVDEDYWELRCKPNAIFITNYLSFERVC